MENYFEHYQYSLEKVNDFIWHIHDATLSNPAGRHIDGSYNNPSSIYLIEDKTQVLLVDLGNPYEDTHLRECVNKISKERKIKVAITHNHFDHIGGLAQFNDCEIYVPCDDPIDNVNHPHIVRDGSVISLDRWHFEVWDVKGHTNGSLAFFEPEQGWFAAGDAFGSSYVWLLFIKDVITTYQNTLKKTIERLQGKKDLLFLCGHRYQQQFSPVDGINPLSPRNPDMNIHYLEDMFTLTQQIQSGIAMHHEFTAFNRTDLAAYTYGRAEIDTYLLGHQPISI